MLNILKIGIVAIPLFFSGEKDKVKKEIIAINKNYYAATTLDVEVTTTAYNITEGRLIKTSKISITRAPGKYHIINGNTESMVNMNYKVNIHHTKKMIIVTKLKNKAPYEKKPDVGYMDGKEFNLNLDTIVDYYKDLKMINLNETDNQLLFLFKDGKVINSKVVYNKTNYRVNSIETTMLLKNKEYRYVMTYNYKPSEMVSKKNFSEKKYFATKKNKLILDKKIADYKLTYNN